MSNTPFFGMDSLIYSLEQSVEWLLLSRQAKSWGQQLSGDEEEDAVPSALLSATPDKIKTQEG